jgi:GTPase SAR1 family protein
MELLIGIVGLLWGIGWAIFSWFNPKREEKNTTLFSGKACRIMMYGLNGSGKTTIIKSILSQERLGTEQPTPNFELYEGDVTLDIGRKKQLKVIFADYKGEKPSQIVFSDSENIVAPTGEKLINTLFFVVDVIPRLYRKGTSEIVQDDDTLARWLGQDFIGRIDKRVAEHKLYITKWNIQLLLSNLLSKNFKSVRLLINKFDILEEASSQNLIELKYAELEIFAKGLFSDIEQEIKEACLANGIKDFAVEVISAKRDIRIRGMFNSVIQIYTEHFV